MNKRVPFQTVKLHEKLGKPIPEVLSAEAQDKDKKKDGTVKAQTPKQVLMNIIIIKYQIITILTNKMKIKRNNKRNSFKVLIIH